VRAATRCRGGRARTGTSGTPGAIPRRSRTARSRSP
jgi:hypothetical protein